QGAAEVSNTSEMASEVRTQISKGADVIKIYSDYRWGRDEEARPAFLVDELIVAVQIAQSSNRKVVAHATTAEGIRRAVLARINTIE
ncbi:hypothetical protein NK918_24490, partial [Salmonella enterica subsp. enterica serovar Typhimurium]|uniref:hypothetical protein n=1 Tax=Salmonella enterica TaxID=28901 RepID=UPI003F763235|nr:hypothetical protein [Salmonella enterica subsp. enterica serovar Typhimurium]